MSGQVWIGGELPEISALKARIAELEAERDNLLGVLESANATAKRRGAERDAAKAEAEKLFADVAQWHARADLLSADLHAAKAEAEKLFAEAEEVLTAYGDPEEDETFAQVVEKIAKNGEEGWGRAGELLQQLDSARAGESRAVDVWQELRGPIEAVVRYADEFKYPDKSVAEIVVSYGAARKIMAALASPAPAWLEEQKTDAVRKALQQLERECDVVMEGDLPHVTVETIRQHIAASTATARRAEAQLATLDPLVEAAEHLLAELGVTEPGAGQDNHEMPVAGMMDALYTAWNNYMRAKHGQADAIFEPEGA